jgi:hypothetical protein
MMALSGQATKCSVAADDDDEPFYLCGLGSYCTGAMFISLRRIARTVQYHVVSSFKHLILICNKL